MHFFLHIGKLVSGLQKSPEVVVEETSLRAPAVPCPPPPYVGCGPPFKSKELEGGREAEYIAFSTMNFFLNIRIDKYGTVYCIYSQQQLLLLWCNMLDCTCTCTWNDRIE